MTFFGICFCYVPFRFKFSSKERKIVGKICGSQAGNGTLILFIVTCSLPPVHKFYSLNLIQFFYTVGLFFILRINTTANFCWVIFC